MRRNNVGAVFNETETAFSWSTRFFFSSFLRARSRFPRAKLDYHASPFVPHPRNRSQCCAALRNSSSHQFVVARSSSHRCFIINSSKRPGFVMQPFAHVQSYLREVPISKIKSGFSTFSFSFDELVSYLPPTNIYRLVHIYATAYGSCILLLPSLH